MKQTVIFLDALSNNVAGILSNPRDDKNIPIIILVHGLGSSKERRTYPALEESLNNHGLSTLRIDLYGHGESYGSFDNLTISKAVESILGAISYLKKQGYEKIGLLGSSFGGISSLMAASNSNDLKLLVLFSSVSNYVDLELEKLGKKRIEEWKKKGYIEYVNSYGIKLKLSFAFFEDAKFNDGYEAAKKINIPTLIIHGDNDMDVPIKQSEKLSKIIKNCKFVSVKGADHRFSDPKYFSQRIKLATDFIIGVADLT